MPRKIARATPTNRKGPLELSKSAKEALHFTLLKEQGDVAAARLGATEEYAMRLLFPETSTAGRVPDDVATKSAVFKTIEAIAEVPTRGVWDPTNNTTSAVTADGPGEGLVLGYPGVRGAYMVQASSQFVALSSDYRAYLPTLNQHRCHVGPAGVKWMSHGLRLGSHVNMPLQDDGGVMVMQWSRSAGLGTEPTVCIKTDPTYTGQLTFRWRYQAVAGGPWTNIDQEIDVRGGIGTETLTSAPACAGLALGLLQPQGESFPDDITFSLVDRSGSVWEADWACHMEMYDASGLEGLVNNRVYKYRPVAGSFLLTYQGSALHDGGNVAGTRTLEGQTMIPKGGDYFQHIITKPDGSYDGQLRDGLYVWWMPSSVQECEYHSINRYALDELEDINILMAYVRLEARNQPLRFKFTIMVESLTDNPTYAVEVSEQLTYFRIVLSILAVMPASTENKLHGKLAGIFRKAISWVKQPKNIRLLLKGAEFLMPRLTPILNNAANALTSR